MAGLQSADGTVILVGHGGIVLVSRDQGKSFSKQQHPDGKALSAALPLADGGLLLLGEMGATRFDLALAKP